MDLIYYQDGAIVIKKMLHIDNGEEEPADTEAPSGGGGKNYGKQVSVQELFDG